jgi:hypothetical protein
MMRDTLKDWLPITARNRVALGFAVLALVLFVTWNLLPITLSGRFFKHFEGSGARFIWRAVFNLDFYISIFKLREPNDFLILFVYIALVFYSLLTLMIIPFWKIIGATPLLKIPFAIMTLAGAFATFYMTDAMIFRILPTCVYVVFLLIILSMFSLSLAFFIFTNERTLLMDMKFTEEMEHAVSRRVLNSRKKT